MTLRHDFVWVTESTALNLALVTRITVERSAVAVLDVRGARTVLEGDDAQRFLAWFNRQAGTSRNG